jgi:DDE superfamily endonuclease
LPRQADQGKIALYDDDASGLALDPTMPSAWQEPNSVIALPARQAGRIHGLGLMHRHNAWPPCRCEASLHTGVVMACVEALCRTITPKTVVVIDQASIQTSDACADRIPSWKKQGLVITYRPPSAPEFNLIDLLGRRIQYPWVPFSASTCLNALSEALEAILSHVGSEYQITFA